MAPSTGTLEVMFGQVESGERKNMSLIHFMSRDEQDVEPLAAKLDKSGILKVTRGYGESTSTEDSGRIEAESETVGTYVHLCTIEVSQQRLLARDQPEFVQQIR